MSSETSNSTTETPILIEIENAYADGHESTVRVRVAPPEDAADEAELDGWWNDVVFPHAGDGHSESMDASYEAKVLEGPAALVGETYEWG